MSLVFVVMLLVAFVVGVMTLPGLAVVWAPLFGLPTTLREALARLLWTLGAVSNGATALRVEGSDWWLERMDDLGDGGYALNDGVVDADDCYQFGLRPFAVISDARDLASREGWTVEHDAPISQRELGGQLVPEFRPWGDMDGLLVDLATVARYFRGAAGNALVMRGLEVGLEESGGQQQLGVVVTTIAFMVMVLLGAGLGWFIA